MRRIATVLLLSATAGFYCFSVQADAPGNPYRAVVDRNPFGLKEPPPPPPETPPAPPVPMVKVVLTGIISSLLSREPTVLVEITEQEPGKAANVKKPILRRGDKEGAIEILSVDAVKNEVRIRNAGIETNLVFEVAKSSGGPAPMPGMPGAIPPPIPSIPLPPRAASASTGPMIISPGGANAAGRANTGVSVFGGAASPVVASAAPVNYAAGASALNTAYNSANYARTGLSPVNNGVNPGVSTYGAGSGFQREVRTDPASTAQQQRVDNNTGVQALDKVGNQYNQSRNYPPLQVPKSLYH